jgi:hypothetical protein
MEGSFGGDFVRLDVSQGTGGGWKAFRIVNILDPEPSAGEGKAGRGNHTEPRWDGKAVEASR